MSLKGSSLLLTRMKFEPETALSSRLFLDGAKGCLPRGTFTIEK
jgi:hypothetical protein